MTRDIFPLSSRDSGNHVFVTIDCGVAGSKVIVPAFRACERTIVGIILLAASCFGQRAAPSDPAELVRRAVHNEIKAANDGDDHLQFRSTKTTPKYSITRIYVQAKEATAGMTVAYDGKALTTEQRQAEEARLQRFVRDPEELRRKRTQEHDDEERTMRIVRAIPDAFLFQYAGEEQSSPGAGRQGHALAKLTFRPNPRYQPPTRVEQVLLGMEGFVLIDAEAGRLAVIDGTLFRDVSFGWGILGHLDKSGHFLVQQEQAAGDVWAITRMNLKFTGKVLLFKNLVIESNEVFSEFKLVPPDVTFAQAVELLLKEETGVPASTEASRNSR